jgi:ATP-binding cassette subfamily B protein
LRDKQSVSWVNHTESDILKEIMKSILRILDEARSLRRYYAAIAVLSVLASLTLVLVPVLTGWAIDEVRHGTEARVWYVVWLAAGLFVLDLLGNVLNNINGYLGDSMSAKLQRLLSKRYFTHLLTLPQKYYDTELSGKIINRLNRSITQITNFMQMFSNNFLQFIITTLFALAAVAYYSWPVALMLASLYPIYILMTMRTSGKWQEYQAEKNKHLDIASGRFAEAVNQIKVVKSFQQQAGELKFFSRHMSSVVRINQPQSKLWHVSDFKRRLVLNLIFLGVYLYVFVSAARGEITPGEAVALVLFAQQIRIPIFTISFLVENTQRAVADSEDYFEIMGLQPEITDKPDAQKLAVRQGGVAFKDVTFGYDDGSHVIKGVDFEVRPGTKLALVGESGEGKTTITNLLLRLYEVKSGSIAIDGQNIQDVTQASLHSAVGVVFQEPALFSGTIRENISYGNPNASLPEVEHAAKAANAHDFIMKFEKGYDSQIGERGLKLSGGQKQRLAIARALLKDAPILILDEATSSLDTRSERAVQEALDRLMKGRTTIIIAHRLSTIAHVDQIITLRGGKIIESGTPAELEKSGGIYAGLLALQRLAPGAAKDKQLKAFEIAG